MVSAVLAPGGHYLLRCLLLYCGKTPSHEQHTRLRDGDLGRQDHPSVRNRVSLSINGRQARRLFPCHPVQSYRESVPSGRDAGQ